MKKDTKLQKILNKKNIRILLTRTDRLGDVMLTTPLFSAIKEKFPSAYLAVMVLPQNRQLVEGNPYVDDVIVYDKRGEQKKWWQHMLFCVGMQFRHFDIALHVHPTNRMHLLSFMARIPVRIGYNKKMSFLLSRRVPAVKNKGEKHEAEYTFDIVKYLGIDCPREIRMDFPVSDGDVHAFDALLEQEGITLSSHVCVINPGASCPSKIWSAKRFALLAEGLIRRFKVDVIIVGDSATKPIAHEMKNSLADAVIDLTGKLDLKMLGVLFSRVKFLISNDTGPVHIAAALGTPVIALFGRSDQGLSPKRWGPIGEKSFYIHKPENCHPCLAHNCEKNFQCLSNIYVDDIFHVLDMHSEIFRINSQD